MALQDGRWRRRLVRMAEEAARHPAGKVTEVFADAAERQGAYGLLESPAVAASSVANAGFQACARRCASEPFVFCPTDGSSLTLTDRNKQKFGSIGTRAQGAQGLKVISVVAISPKGVTEGVAAQVWWAREERVSRRHRESRAVEEKETGRWLEAMEKTREVMRLHAPTTRAWFQLDREGDAWPILEQADAGGHWFTVRGNHDRRVILATGKKALLRTVLSSHPVVTRYELAVPAGPHRAARTAIMEVRACAATLDFKDKRTGRHSTKVVNVMLAREVGTTPGDEKPIDWLLLTNRPIATQEELLQVVFGYSLRWRIEDFHRSWKSGTCRVEDSQLRSREPVIKWATILACVALRVERLKQLSRREPDRPASDEFRPLELRAIKLLRFGKTAKGRPPDGNVPTLAEATLWLAQIGGYTGKSSGGPPGSVTLSRGLEQIQAVVRALEALEPSCD